MTLKTALLTTKVTTNRCALLSAALLISVLATTSSATAQSGGGTAEAGQASKPKAGGKDNGSKRIVIDRVAAVVNNEVILESDLRVNTLPLIADLQNIADASERKRREKNLVGQVLEQMIEEELIVQAARGAKLRIDKQEVDAAMDEIRKQNNLDDQAFEQALAMQGFTKASYRRNVERQLLRMRTLNMMVRPRVTITDEDVRARYDERNRRSGAVSSVYLRQILVGLPPQPSDEQVAKAKAEAAELIERVKNGESFTDLAKAHSDDQATQATGGDLGWIERGSLASEWEAVVFAMDKGDVRGPISGPGGLRVFYVEDVKKSQVKSFDELKEQLRNELTRREMEKQTETWVKELRKKAYIKRKL
ncbi:MAG: peptidylprolyl isomerase [Myxococcota bacterium]